MPDLAAHLVRSGVLAPPAAARALALLREAAAKDDLSAEAQGLLGVALARQGILFEAAAALARAAEACTDEKRRGDMQVRLMQLLGT